MKKVLLHVCCGVCALYAVEKLKEEGYLVEGLFFNPNIYPVQEYQRRSQAAKEALKLMGAGITEDEYDSSLWFGVCGEYKDEKEGGGRCQLCYRLRLERTFSIMRERGFDFFTTTLTISPHKNSAIINEIGKDIGEDSFLAIDFKKKDGFKRTMELAKQYNLYRQKYCGCIYSRK